MLQMYKMNIKNPQHNPTGPLKLMILISGIVATLISVGVFIGIGISSIYMC
jgi:hypothetical protein